MASAETVSPPSAAASAPPVQADERHLRIALALGDTGWSVTDDFLPAALVASLAAEARAAWQSGDFRLAGTGHGADLRLNPEIRTDRVKWLDPLEATDAQRAYLQALEGLRLAINQTLYLGLLDFEGHLAVYPPGSFYRKHLDRFRGVAQRVVTVILYLNEGWQAEDGGHLRIYTDAADEACYSDVAPVAGRLVTFLSAGFPHEVMPARRERLSFSGWLKQRASAGC
jgi:SM-20-related protein